MVAFLADDPRRSPWRDAIRATQGLGEKLPGPGGERADSLRPDESAVAEALNVAWAMHEIVSDQWAETLSWLRANVTPPLVAPAKKRVVEASSELR